MNRYSTTHTHTHTHGISIGKIATCQLLFLAPSLTLPQPTLALFYRLGKFWSICFCCEKRKRNVPSLFYSAVCWETSERNWRVEWQKGLHSVWSCFTEGLYQGTAHLLGGAPARECHRGRARADDPKWGIALILVGPHVTKEARGFFCEAVCQAKRMNFSFGSLAENQKR